EIEAPTLEEAAPQAFEHLPLWENAPRRNQTAFSLVEEVLCAAMTGDRESYLLDRNILGSVAAFGRVLDLGFDKVVLDGSSSASSAATVTLRGLRRHPYRFSRNSAGQRGN